MEFLNIEKNNLEDEIRDLQNKLTIENSEDKKMELKLKLDIALLKFKINGYEIELNQANDPTLRSELRGLIKSRADNLDKLLLQQQAREERQFQIQQGNRGNLFLISFKHIILIEYL